MVNNHCQKDVASKDRRPSLGRYMCSSILTWIHQDRICRKNKKLLHILLPLFHHLENLPKSECVGWCKMAGEANMVDNELHTLIRHVLGEIEWIGIIALMKVMEPEVLLLSKAYHHCHKQLQPNIAKHVTKVSTYLSNSLKVGRCVFTYKTSNQVDGMHFWMISKLLFLKV